MMEKIRKLTVLLLALVMLVSLGACGGSASETSDETAQESSDAAQAAAELTETTADLDYESADLSGLNIGYVTINASAPWGKLVGTSFAEYAQSVGASVTSMDAATSSDTVTEYCEELIDDGVDVLVIFGGSADANAQTAQAAYEAGIPVFLAALDVAEEGREYVAALVGPDQEQAFADIADYIVEENGTDEEYTVVQISGVSFLQDYIDREAGFTTAMAAYSNYDLSTEVEYAYSSRNDAKEYMNEFIETVDGIDILMGYDDDLTMGAVEAIEEAGLGDEIKVYSFTGQADAIQAVIDGQIELTVMNRATDIGAGLVTTIAAYLENGSVDYYQRTELTYITSENAEEYLELAEF